MPADFEQSVERRRRLILIERALIGGVRDFNGLAIRFGVSQNQIRDDVGLIMEGWRHAGPLAFEERRELRIRQLEDAFTDARNGYALSKQKNSDADEAAERKDVPCARCNGSGFVADEWCVDCEGDGVKSVPVKVTIKVRHNKAGDPAFLMAALGIMREINLLEGNHAPKRIDKQSKVAGVVVHTTNAGRLRQIPSTALLTAKAALDRLESPIVDGVVDESDKSKKDHVDGE